MIGKIKGKVDTIDSTYCLIETNSGVYYKINLSPLSLNQLKSGENTELLIHTHVRENEISLYGFSSNEELKLFNILINISSIGPKTAIIIIGFNKVEKLIAAVKEQNSHYFSSIPGIGKKMSQKILLELSGKFDTEFKLNNAVYTEEDNLVIDALVSLGFKKSQADSVFSKIPKTGTLQEKITKALKYLSNNESR
jgi:Holliday junction DNA helicase RuvA